MKTQDIVVCWSLFLSWVLLPFSFFFLPHVPWRGTWSHLASLSFWEAVSQSWWDTEHCLEEVMLKPVDDLWMCHCSGVLNLQWYVPVCQCTLVCDHSILIGFIFNSNQPLNQVILTCLPLPLFFLGWIGLALFLLSHSLQLFERGQGNLE